MKTTLKKIKTGFHAGHYQMICSEAGVTFKTLIPENSSSSNYLETFRALKKQVSFSLFLLSA